MNEAMSKGLWFKMQLNMLTVNLMKNEFGPPTFAEFNKTNNDSSKTAHKKKIKKLIK